MSEPVATSYGEMNPWEAQALEYQYSEAGQQAQAQAQLTATAAAAAAAAAASYDQLIYPGLYSGTRFNAMDVLLCIMSRPNPQVDLGSVDMSCPIIICDVRQPDQPIVYATDAFCQLTGYRVSEILGRNCRFLQAPGGNVAPRSVRCHVDKETLRRMRKAVQRGTELQIEVPNFRKTGERFVNFLTIIPVAYGEERYSVGFQCEVGT